MFSNSLMSATTISPFEIHPQFTHIRRIFRVRLACQVVDHGRTQGRPPFHPNLAASGSLQRALPLPATPFQCPRSRTATLELGGAAPFPPLAWLYIEPSPCGGVRPAGDPIDSDPRAVFEDGPQPRSDAGRPLGVTTPGCRRSCPGWAAAHLTWILTVFTSLPCYLGALPGQVGPIGSPYHEATTHPCEQPGSSSFASSLEVLATPTKRYHGKTLTRPSLPCVCLFSSFSHSFSLPPLHLEFFEPWMHKTMMSKNSPLLKQCDLDEVCVQLLLALVSCSRRHQQHKRILSCFPYIAVGFSTALHRYFAKHCCWHRNFQLSSSGSHCELDFFIVWFNEEYSSQMSGIVELWFLDRPSLFCSLFPLHQT